jgi:hypothetical protein
MSIVSGFLKGGVAAGATLATEGALTPVQAELLAAILAELECDPDPCHFTKEYRIRLKPAFPRPRVKYRKDMIQGLFRDPVSEQTVRLMQKCVDALGRVPTIEFAVFETCCRVYSAKVSGDEKALRMQRAHKVGLIDQAARVKKHAEVAFDLILTHLKETGIKSRVIPVKDRLPEFERMLAENRLPKLEILILKDYGISGVRLSRLTKFMSDNLGKMIVPTTFTGIAKGVIRIMRNNKDIAQCTCAE